MNRDLGGETEFLELEAHRKRLDAHTNILEQEIVTHEDNKIIREKGDNNKEFANENNEEIILESSTITPLINNSSQNVLFDHIRHVPLDYSSNELETMSNDSDSHTSHYPYRKTKGIPILLYEPNQNAHCKYHISNYTSTKIL